MVTPALSVRSLSKRFELYDRPVDRLKQTLWRGRRQFFREFWALRDIAFTLAPGQALGVVGRNGSGKSTLLQLVAGTLTPTLGEVHTRGRVSALLELGSGFNSEFTGRENVFLNGAILGLEAAEVRSLLPGMLEFADIGEFIDRPVMTYSSGMALRLAFAVATAVSPRLLIVDEALAVGDEAFQRKCFARIERMREDGTAVLFVSHSPQQILELCDVALLLDAGQMLLLDEPRRVVPEYQRLLYASAESAGRIRARLAGGAIVAAAEVATAADPVSAPGVPSANGAPPGVAAQSPGVAADAPAENVNAPAVASFDAELRPASTVEYATHGARIQAPLLTTLQGESVNVLVRGDDYFFRYEVEFQKTAQRVRFGMMIKTVSGLELGGSTLPDAGSLARSFTAGDRVTLSFRFRCQLHPGMYFLNCGLMGEVDGVDTYLHRLVDATAFRVQTDASRKHSGYVDFDVRPTLEEGRAA